MAVSLRQSSQQVVELARVRRLGVDLLRRAVPGDHVQQVVDDTRLRVEQQAVDRVQACHGMRSRARSSSLRSHLPPLCRLGPRPARTSTLISASTLEPIRITRSIGPCARSKSHEGLCYPFSDRHLARLCRFMNLNKLIIEGTWISCAKIELKPLLSSVRRKPMSFPQRLYRSWRTLRQSLRRPRIRRPWFSWSARSWLRGGGPSPVPCGRWDTQTADWAKYHHVLNHAQWSGLELSRPAPALAGGHWAPAAGITVDVDETLERRWGPRMRKRGNSRDGLASSKQVHVSSSGCAGWCSAWWSTCPGRLMRWPCRFSACC